MESGKNDLLTPEPGCDCETCIYITNLSLGANASSSSSKKRLLQKNKIIKIVDKLKKKKYNSKKIDDVMTNIFKHIDKLTNLIDVNPKNETKLESEKDNSVARTTEELIKENTYLEWKYTLESKDKNETLKSILSNPNIPWDYEILKDLLKVKWNINKYDKSYGTSSSSKKYNDIEWTLDTTMYERRSPTSPGLDSDEETKYSSDEITWKINYLNEIKFKPNNNAQELNESNIESIDSSDKSPESNKSNLLDITKKYYDVICDYSKNIYDMIHNNET